MASTLFNASHLPLLCTRADADKDLQWGPQDYGIQYDMQYMALTDANCTWYLKIHEKFIKLGTPTLKIQRKRESQSISYLFC